MSLMWAGRAGGFGGFWLLLALGWCFGSWGKALQSARAFPLELHVPSLLQLPGGTDLHKDSSASLSEEALERLGSLSAVI